MFFIITLTKMRPSLRYNAIERGREEGCDAALAGDPAGLIRAFRESHQLRLAEAPGETERKEVTYE